MQLLPAEAIAKTIVTRLQPHCERIHIAGSIRRQVLEVKDIEIVCQPKIENAETDLFGTTTKTYRSTAFIKALSLCFTELKVGNIMDGRYAKLCVGDIMLDLFTPQPGDYYRILAIRTGSKEYAQHVIAAGWLRKGWCGVKDIGLRRKKDCIEEKHADGKSTWKLVNKNGELPPVWQSEEEFFAWIGEPFVEPRWRMGVSKSQKLNEAR